MYVSFTPGYSSFPILPDEETIRRQEFASRIHREGQWYHYGEEEAGAARIRGNITNVPLAGLFELSCEICDIFMGPGHEEQEIWFYPVYQTALKTIALVHPRLYTQKVFRLCGKCAHRKQLTQDIWSILTPASWSFLHEYAALRIEQEVKILQYFYEYFLDFLVWITVQHRPMTAHFFFRLMTQLPVVSPAVSLPAATSPSTPSTLYQVASLKMVEPAASTMIEEEELLHRFCPSLSQARAQLLHCPPV